MKKSKKKLIIIIGAVVLVVALVAVNLLSSRNSGTDVQSEIVKRRDLTETVSASGRIQPQTKVDITAEVNGEIVALHIREGDRVEIGDPLIYLDTIQLRSDVDQARYMLSEVRARLEGAKSGLEQARENFDIQERLYESGSASEIEYKRDKYSYQSAKSSFEALQAQENQYRSRLDKIVDELDKAKIVAPMAGVITFLDCEVGEIAAAQSAYSQGRTLMTISDMEVFEVDVEVDETEINKIALSQIVDIEVDAFPDTSFSGEVIEIGNTAISSGLGTENQSTNFRVKVVFLDPRVKLRPGMSATVDITSARGDDVLAIPYSAVVMRTLDMDSLEQAHLAVSAESSSVVGEVHAAEIDSTSDTISDDDDIEREEIKGVFVIRDNIARFVQVETGIADKRRIEVLSGLQENDSVVSGPYRILRSIKDGDQVKITKMGEGKDDNEGGD